MVDEAIVAANEAATRELAALLARLSDADFERDLGEGWNVATALAHVAFWDRRAVRVFERWQRDGTPYRDQDDDILNDALLDEWRALPPRAAADLALAAARAIDAVVVELPNVITAALTADGNEFLMRHYNHRREHIEQIEAGLGVG
jgi:hypothetical protein